MGNTTNVKLYVMFHLGIFTLWLEFTSFHLPVVEEQLRNDFIDEW